jgi:hypothetical protein
MTGVQTFRKKPLEVKAIQFDGTNVADIWDAFGAEGIYGPTETNPDHLILTTTHGDPAPARVGDWIVPDSKPNTFYPIAAEVMERTYDDASAAPPASDEAWIERVNAVIDVFENCDDEADPGELRPLVLAALGVSGGDL